MRLKELREERHLTQNDIAKEIKTSQTNIGRWEKELNEPAASFIIRLADFFQCSTDYLLGREDDLGNITIHTEKPAPLPQDEQTLLNNFRKLPQDLRHRAAVYMQNLADAAEEESFNFHGGKNYGNITKTLYRIDGALRLERRRGRMVFFRRGRRGDPHRQRRSETVHQKNAQPRSGIIRQVGYNLYPC